MADIKIARRVLGALGTNCYFVWNTDNKECIIFDPAAQADVIYNFVQENGLKVVAVYLTHGHFDHILAADAVREKYGVKINILDEDMSLAMNAQENLSEAFSYSYVLKADGVVSDGQVITVSGMTFRVIHTPGHTKGSCCYYFEEAGILISGDTLFNGSVGRTDFPTGSTSSLYRSIKDKLLILPDDTLVYPGHGDETTIGESKKFFAGYGY